MDPRTTWIGRHPTGHHFLPALLAAVALAVGCSTATKSQAECEPPCDDVPAAAPAPAIPHAVVTTTAVDDLEAAFKRAIAAAGPSVVSVYSARTVSLAPWRGPFGSDPMFEFFFQDPRLPPRELRQQGLGSGFVVDTDGYIVTNNHVVEGADEVKVKLADERELDAEVIGTDPPTDLALLKVDAHELQPIALGDSIALEVGDWVLAIGDPFGLPQTVSAGIVSAKGRANMGIMDYEDFIQTDAAVNPGNSGGRLVDLEGRVVGINTAIASQSGGNNGIAFAIPIDMARNVIEQLRGGGKVIRGQLGVVISELSKELAESFGFDGKEGILVQDVAKGSAAEKAGMKAGDIITKLDGREVGSVAAFRSEVARKRPGSTVELEVWRKGEREQVSVELGEAPGSAGGASPAARGEPPKLGLRLDDLTPELRGRLGIEKTRGAVVMGVEPGSPAAGAGIRVGDVIEQVGDREVDNAAQALKLLRDADLEKGVRLRVSRGGQGRFVVIKVKRSK